MTDWYAPLNVCLSNGHKFPSGIAETAQERRSYIERSYVEMIRKQRVIYGNVMHGEIMNFSYNNYK